MKELEHISLFTGIGGIDLAAEWAGFKTILMVENNLYCRRVLNKHWPDVPILEDIYDVNRKTIQEALANAFGRGEQQSKGDIAEGRGRISNGGEEVILNTDRSRCENRSEEYRGEPASSGEGVGGISRPDTIPAGGENKRPIKPITIITGGFPCQPVSGAGQRRGKEDDRWLWPEMLRVIKEIRPRWVVAENVAGLINMGLDDCISDLESEGYTVEPYLIPACAVNAPHRRDRIFIVANSNRQGLEGCKEGIRPWMGNRPKRCSQDVADTEAGTLGAGLRQGAEGGQWGRRFSNGGGQDVTEPSEQRLEGANAKRDTRTGGCPDEYGQRGWNPDWWAVEPSVGRVANGIPSRVDRLKCLGNAVVPQQVYPILKAIARIEYGT